MANVYPVQMSPFFEREVQALRAQMVDVQIFSVLRPRQTDRANDGERAATFHLSEANPVRLAAAHLALLARGPRPFLRACLLALRTSPPGWRGFVRQLFHFRCAVLLARAMRRSGLERLHAHGTDTSVTVAMLGAELGGFSFSFSVHGPGVFFAVKARSLEEKLRRAVFVRCISHFCRSQCLVWVPERTDRFHVVHCGVDPAAYTLRTHRGHGQHIVFVGRLVGRKGLPVLIEALARLRRDRAGVHLTIIGEGPERAALERRARSAGVGDHVTFAGHQSPAQVTEWLAKGDVFALPSFAEGVPVVLMEAMAAGLPVVATNVNGVSELVDDGVNGFLVPPGIPGPLAARVGELLDDPLLRARMGRAGREKVLRDFDVHREMARLRRLLTGASEDGMARSAAHEDEEGAPR